jgi:hypothetical protein
VNFCGSAPFLSFKYSGNDPKIFGQIKLSLGEFRRIQCGKQRLDCDDFMWVYLKSVSSNGGVKKTGGFVSDDKRL